MLVVIAIMAMLMVVAVPSLDYALRGGALSRAGTLLESVIAQARQEALSRNRDVEVRWASWEQPGEGTAWGVQAFRIEREVSGDQSLPIGRLTRLPNTVKVVEKEGGIDYSPLLSSATWSGTNMSIPGVASAATYRAFRLRPDGRLTPLPPTPFQDNNFLSIALKTKAASQNYYTIAINPLTGQILSFRP